MLLGQETESKRRNFFSLQHIKKYPPAYILFFVSKVPKLDIQNCVFRVGHPTYTIGNLVSGIDEYIINNYVSLIGISKVSKVNTLVSIITKSMPTVKLSNKKSSILFQLRLTLSG